MSGRSFPIRGHHLPKYASLAQGLADPASLDDFLVKRHGFTQTIMSPAAQANLHDITGGSRHGARRVYARRVALYERFLGLKDDDPVTLTTGERDGICQSALVGRHCPIQGQEIAMTVDERAVRVYDCQLSDMYNVGKFLSLGQSLQAAGVIDMKPGAIQYHEVDEVTPSNNALPLAQSFFGGLSALSADIVSYQVPVTIRADFLRSVLTHWA
jgi:hypothetical protein